MSKSFALRQTILAKQGKITPELAQARIEQYQLMRRLKKEAIAQGHPTKEGGGK